MGNEYQKMLRDFKSCQARIEKRLEEFFVGYESYSVLLESMRYSLLAGGKRIRAIMCLKFCEAAGGGADKAIEAACAIEMLHTYSLIHDDLPCMDNDSMRRGKPSNHIKYDVSTATLAGDALQAAAFETLLHTDLPPVAVVKMAEIFAKAAGPHGICGGQYLDVRSEGRGLGQAGLEEIHMLKTAALISASAQIGVVAADGTAEQLKAAEEYALAVGFAFQIRDDVIDCVSTSDRLGKPAGSDKENDKTTFMSLYGERECEILIDAWTKRAISALRGKFDDPGFLEWLALMLASRSN